MRGSGEAVIETRADALIVGGGLAGSMLALELARAGRSAVVLERSKGPHDKVCGEFLSHEALLYLGRHNVDVHALGGVPLRLVRLVLSDATVEVPLPFAACSLTRRVLDEALLQRAAQTGAEVHRNSTVEALEQKQGAWHATLRDGRSAQAAHAFLATGKHDLRGWPRPQGTHRGLVAFKQYFRLTPQQHAALGHAIELILFPGGYAGMQPVENGGANLCLVIDSYRLKEVGSNWAGLMSHLRRTSAHLAQRLQGAAPLLDTPLAASHIPYGHMQRTSNDGLWRVGDQAAVIPSFCGDGMAIALHSGTLAAQHFLDGASPAAYQRRLHAQLALRLSVATRLSQLIVAWPQAAQLVRPFPHLLTYIAAMTRIPKSALIAPRPIQTHSLRMTVEEAL